MNLSGAYRTAAMAVPGRDVWFGWMKIPAEETGQENGSERFQHRRNLETVFTTWIDRHSSLFARRLDLFPG